MLRDRNATARKDFLARSARDIGIYPTAIDLNSFRELDNRIHLSVENFCHITVTDKPSQSCMTKDDDGYHEGLAYQIMEKMANDPMRHIYVPEVLNWWVNKVFQFPE